MKSFVRYCVVFLPLMVTALPGTAFATGGWVPDRWLDEGGASLKGTPEFYWDIEMKRLAAMHAEKNLPQRFQVDPFETSVDDKTAATTATDLTDFEDALKTQRIKPANVDEARAAQKAMREWIDKGADGAPPQVTEADSEFADYHRGVVLRAGKQWEECAATWEKLLQRPAEQRHYRSVWAAYMLGRELVDSEDSSAKAIAWFEKCRQFAREGFADSTNLAAASYGWQARVELDAGQYAAAARHYLQQLALGDSSAIISLKRLVIDSDLRASLDLLPADADAAKKTQVAKDISTTVGDEVLRQIITAHILACFNDDYSEPDTSRVTWWLDMIQNAKLDHVDDAASLGWSSYAAGRYDEAEKWLLLDKPATSRGNWLRAKLALRKGAFTEASSLMTTVVPELPEDEAVRHDVGYLPKASASAELGAAFLAQGKFTEALAAFITGGCWSDAAYVAERVLTTDELTRFVKAHAVLADDVRAKRPENDEVAAMHWEVKNSLMNLSGRRLIREDKLAEGRLMLEPQIRADFDHFIALVAAGRDAQKPKQERAKSLFKAAVRLRSNGSSWQGTEDDYERVAWGGYAPGSRDELIKTRRSGSMNAKDDSGDDTDSKTTEKRVPLFIPSSPPEKKRLMKNPSASFQMERYVIQAANLAVKAAALLPDNTEETADVLNQAGRWIQDLDNPGADKIYFQIEKRCPQTEIGKAVIAKHWFIEPNGPWTNEPATPEAPEASAVVEPSLPDAEREKE